MGERIGDVKYGAVLVKDNGVVALEIVSLKGNDGRG